MIYLIIAVLLIVILLMAWALHQQRQAIDSLDDSVESYRQVAHQWADVAHNFREYNGRLHARNVKLQQIIDDYDSGKVA